MTTSQNELCPDHRWISEYLAGHLGDAEAEAFEQHLESCECCVAALSMNPGPNSEPEWLARAREHAQHTGARGPSYAVAPAEDGVKSSSSGQVSVRYTWIRRIGAGGMGEVWEGWDHMMRRPVALKKLRHQHTDNEGPQRLLQEAIVLSRLSHPHIVTVHEVTLEHSQPVLVMEFIPGMTLADWQNGRPLRQRDAAEAALVLAQALQHAHAQSVIHRDLKPSNVLLRTETREALPRGENGQLCLWLSDFGLARAIDDPSFTSIGQVLGTPFYMAPEQAGGGNTADIRSDIYGLGAILYELLTGIPPFMGNDKAVVLQRIQTEDPVAPRRLQPRLSRDIETICLKCLARRPVDRYNSATAVAADLAAFLEGRPIQARPLGIALRLARWGRRNPVNAALVISTIAAILTAGGFAAVAVREQGQMLQISQRAAEQEKALRQRAETAEQGATQREQRESRRRQQYQALLLKTISILDDVQTAAAEQMSADPAQASPANTPSASFTRQLLAAVIPLVEQSEDPPGWSELEIVTRFLRLRQVQQAGVDISVLINKVDQFLKLHENNPEDPEAFVSFVYARQHFFDLSVNFRTQTLTHFHDWLRLAAQFRRQADTCALDSPRIPRLLKARSTAIGYAHAAWKVCETLQAEGRSATALLLQSLIDELRQPIPQTIPSREEQQQLLELMEHDLKRFTDQSRL